MGAMSAIVSSVPTACLLNVVLAIVSGITV